ncbi:MAG TPA: response regulator [Nitrospira sp.]|nr:response regulator [Nitrospira sp.]
MPRRILVIDHDDQTRLATCHRLTQWGFDAVGEANGLSGLALLAQATPDRPFAGMLLELDMPVLGGMAVLQEMKDRHPAIPVLVMAEARHIEKLRGAVRMWAREYIVKPFDMELLKMKCVYVFTERPQRT